MKIEEVGQMTPYRRFVYWIYERHRIYRRRKKGKPKPWTDDQILQTIFFTNPYRENDKVTQWFRNYVRDRLADNSDVLFATICFRWFNYIPTGIVLKRENLLRDWVTKRAVKLLKEQEGKVFTGAFNISNSGSTKPKINRVCEDYIKPVWDDRRQLIKDAKRWSSLQEAHQRISRYPGMGGSGFMAYEVVCDLRYTRFLNNAADKNTWSNPGPGARRGLNRILGRDVKTPISKKEWEHESIALLSAVHVDLGEMPTFEMREIEHSLCEFDKYERARLNEGHLKRKYDGK